MLASSTATTARVARVDAFKARRAEMVRERMAAAERAQAARTRNISQRAGRAAMLTSARLTRIDVTRRKIQDVAERVDRRVQEYVALATSLAVQMRSTRARLVAAMTKARRGRALLRALAQRGHVLSGARLGTERSMRHAIESSNILSARANAQRQNVGALARV